jgi:TonB family protein
MKNILLVLLVSAISLYGTAQTSETKYYRGRPYEEVERSKATVSKTTVEDQGIITTTTKDLKKDKIINRDSWKGDEPVSSWIILTGKGPEELDYNFDLQYGEKVCSNQGKLQQTVDLLHNNYAIGYTAPKIEGKESNVPSFYARNARYSGRARKSGIQGTVEMVFTIDSKGVVKDIIVTKGAHIMLDKEAVRIVRKLKFSSPAMLDGQPTEVCVRLPLTFRLA